MLRIDSYRKRAGGKHLTTYSIARNNWGHKLEDPIGTTYIRSYGSGGSLVPRLLPTSLSHTYSMRQKAGEEPGNEAVCDKEVGRSLGTRLSVGQGITWQWTSLSEYVHMNNGLVPSGLAR